ncbi:hypothetical protein sS8_2738 [Methylocaldum marinum]|uniref:Uncharacterized protein n=1 Tax=Methylocaldum marinum TaxID=1432792 RepID=A0A250KSM1_9GAMM|nr:hypothetical protein sS8_2738 [Methylocaldum marinum]
MKKPKAAAAEARARRLYNSERRAYGYRGIESVAAFFENFKAGLRG